MAKARKSNADHYAEVTDRVIATIEAQLEAGDPVPPWRKTWAGGFGIPTNVQGRGYRGINVIILWLTAEAKGWDLQRWGTHRMMRELAAKCARKRGMKVEEREVGRTKWGPKIDYFDADTGERLPGGVKKGERSTEVWLWKWIKKNEVDPDTGETKKIRVPLIRVFSVFNVAQVDGIEEYTAELRADRERSDFEPHEGAEEIVNHYFGEKDSPGFVENDEPQAYYDVASDNVHMPTRTKFDSPDCFYDVLFHELVHSTGHPSRLNRFKKDASDIFDRASYSAEELVAEIGGAFLCSITGIDNPDITNNTIAYLRGWLKRLKDDPRLLVTAAQRAQRAVDLITGVTFDNGEDD